MCVNCHYGFGTISPTSRQRGNSTAFKPISLQTIIFSTTMMKSCSIDSPKPNLYPNMDWKTLLLPAVAISSVFILFFLPSPNTYIIIAPIQSPNKLYPGNTSSECDLFTGRWVSEPRGSIYTNWTCPMLPDANNCAKHGKGLDHVFWKWKPQGCELPRFDPNTFLSIVRGKKMAFVGDSLARNQMESLLCLLSQAEPATEINNVFNFKFQTWYHPSHDFTLMYMWAEFLVDGTERTVNGSGTGIFDLHLDRVNPIWAEKLSELHYLIISGGNWFIRKNYYYENGNLTGCAGCSEENVTELGIGFAIRKAFRTSLQFISRCEECDGLVALLRTYSPGHFQHGSWDNGGYCNATRPLNENETEFVAPQSLKFRMIQLEEAEEWKGKRKVEVLDVTKAMMLRADGHPDSFFRGGVPRIVTDCLHWCLPGPIDMWNDVLLATLKKKSLLL